ncbi:tetratricopeptide repeat protein [Fredinandcohnia humi]
MEIGSRIRFFRIQKNMTQEELADKIISISYLSKIENNQTSASIEVLEMLCDRLGIKLIEDEEYTILKELNDWYYKIIHKKKDEAVKFYESFEKKTNSNDSRVAILYVLYELRYFIFTRQLDKAEEHINKINLFKDILDTKMNYYYEKFVGHFHYLLNRFSVSLKYFKESERILGGSIHFESWEQADLFYYIGLVYNRLGKLALSIVYIQKALSIYQSLYDLKRSAECQILLGISYEKIDEFELAEENYRLAHKVAEGINDSHLLGMIYHNLGIVMSKQEKALEAIEHYKKSLQFKTDQMIVGKLRTIQGLIEEYYNLGNIEKSQELLKQGKSLVEKNKELNLREYEIHFMYYDYLYYDSDNLAKFIEKEALPYFEGTEHLIQIASYAEKLGKYYYENHKYKLASHYLSKAVTLLKKQGHINIRS